MPEAFLAVPARTSVARRLSFLDRYLTLWTLRDHRLPDETGELAKVANCAVTVERPAAGRAK